MASRYDNRIVAVNDNEQYKEEFKKRGVKFVRQFNTPILHFLTADEIAGIDTAPHTWTVGSRFYKLADEYYGDSEYWWIIAWYNGTPTESHVKIGDTVFVPLPLEKILELLSI